MSMHGAMRKQYINVTCLHGPCFVVAWNIYILCNLLCATMFGIAFHGVATDVTAMQEHT